MVMRRKNHRMTSLHVEYGVQNDSFRTVQDTDDFS